MPIHDQSYRHWEGKFRSHTLRWWVITKEGLRIILRRKVFLIFIMAPPAVLFFVFGAIVYGINAYGKLFNLNIVDAKFFVSYLTGQTFFIILICVFAGSGLIANDLKNNSLQFYFSKPLTRLDYLVGKTAIVMVLMAFLTIVPGIVLFLENAILSEGTNFLRSYYWMFGSIVLYSLVLTLPTSLLILALSAVTRSNRYAAISFMAILIGTPILSEILKEVTKLRSASFISYWSNMASLGKWLFGLSSGSASCFWSLCIILGVVGLCAAVMYRRIKGVEIVK